MFVSPGTAFVTELLVPFRLKACPTLPAAKVVPPTRTPLFVPAMSFAFPSAGHHSTNPEGGVRQAALTFLSPRQRMIVTRKSEGSAQSRLFIESYCDFPLPAPPLSGSAGSTNRRKESDSSLSQSSRIQGKNRCFSAFDRAAFPP